MSDFRKVLFAVAAALCLVLTFFASRNWRVAEQPDLEVFNGVPAVGTISSVARRMTDAPSTEASSPLVPPPSTSNSKNQPSEGATTEPAVAPPLTAPAVASTTLAATSSSNSAVPSGCLPPVDFKQHVRFIYPDQKRNSPDLAISAAADVTDQMKQFATFAVYISMGNGELAAMKPWVMMNTDVRLNSEGTAVIMKAAAAHPRGTMFVLWLEDRSPFCFKAQRDAAEALNKKYPRLFWLTMNSCIVEPATGAIGEREIPVPGFDTYGDTPVERETAAKGLRTKRRRVSWRGATTGEDWADYREAPRWRGVSKFLEVKHDPKTDRSVAEAIDVAFSGRVQNVHLGIVPDSMMGHGISHLDLQHDQVQVDLDGNANAWAAFKWKLACGSAVLKHQTRYVQYYYRQLVNGTHVLLYDSMDDLVRMATRLVAAPQSEETLQLMERLANHSSDFARDHLVPAAMKKDLEEMLLCAGRHARTIDWRIQSG
jgi:hypothetical protein